MPFNTIAQNRACNKIMISKEYGMLKVETNPSKEQTAFYISLLRDQIRYQALTEIIRPCEPPKFHFGLRFGALVPENTHIPPMKKKDIIQIHQHDNQTRYAYSSKDQYGGTLPPINTLHPIINDIECYLGVDMSDYDTMIGNIYLDSLYIPAHQDTTESSEAVNYPVIVYTLGNRSSLGFWDSSRNNTLYNQYSSNSFVHHNLGYPNNEVCTKNGTVYTIGYEGNGRFDLIHTTPERSVKPEAYPPILLPDTNYIRSDLRNKTIAHYTITLTFRRAKDLSNNTPISPKRLPKE